MKRLELLCAMFAVAGTFAAFTSCSEDEKPLEGAVTVDLANAVCPEKAVLTEKTLTVESDGGKAVLPLGCMIENVVPEYTLSETNIDWADVALADGKLTLDFKATASNAVNVATFTISATAPGTIITPLEFTISQNAFKSAVPMVLVEGGTFTFGNGYTLDTETGAPKEYNRKYAHEVTLSSYYVSVTEVTQKVYQEVMGKNPTDKVHVGDNKPVVNLKWADAIEFCNALSEKEGLTPVYVEGQGPVTGMWGEVIMAKDWIMQPGANGYRLLTSAEWEFAAKGGNAGAANPTVFAGSNDWKEVAWTKGNSTVDGKPVLQEVAQKKANALGIYDLCGNAEEWCFDWSWKYGTDEIRASKPETNPSGPVYGVEADKELSGFSMKTGRGGGAGSDYGNAYINYERGLDPGYYTTLYGLRIARSL